MGARPQFVKIAPVVRAAEAHGLDHVIVHTGRRYDPMLSDVFLQDLGIPTPDVHLGVGSGAHGVQTGAMLASLDGVLDEHRPDWVPVYGDTNSTLAAALSGVTMHLPCRPLSGPDGGRDGEPCHRGSRLPVPPGRRHDDRRAAPGPRRRRRPTLLLAHPRLVARASAQGLDLRVGNLVPHEPLAFPDLIAAALASAGIVTDSGGLQKEAFLLGAPCTTVREETEWVETVELGWNVLANSAEEVADAVSRPRPPPPTRRRREGATPPNRSWQRSRAPETSPVARPGEVSGKQEALLQDPARPVPVVHGSHEVGSSRSDGLVVRAPVQHVAQHVLEISDRGLDDR